MRYSFSETFDQIIGWCPPPPPTLGLASPRLKNPGSVTELKLHLIYQTVIRALPPP